MKTISNSFIYEENGDKKCMVVLNTDMNSTLFRFIWESTSIHITADGAANRLYYMFPKERDVFIPNYIIGDIDSAEENVLEYYKSVGTVIIHDPNQDNTDLDKCLYHIKELCKNHQVLIYGDLGGRMDHSFGVVNSLFFAKDYFEDLVLVGKKSTMRLLAPGEYILSRSTQLRNHDGNTCGLIPLGGWLCSHVTTTGLKWNLDDASMRFGELVSSSNCMVEENVTLKTDSPLLWILSTEWDMCD